MSSLRPSKFLKTTTELTFTTQKASACSPCKPLFCFRLKVHFLHKFDPKTQNYQFKLKFCTKTNSNIQNSYSDVHFFSFWLEIPFWPNLVQKLKLVSLSWNFALNYFEYAELCRKYVVFTFSVLERKNPFWPNLVKKIKIFSLTWNLVPRLIWICGIQWWQSFFQFLTGNNFLGKFGPKSQTC